MIFSRYKQIKKQHNPIFIPITITFLVSLIYGITDTYIVSLINEQSVAAVGLVQPFSLLAFILIGMISSGTGVPLSKAFGAKRKERFKKKLFTGIIISYVVTLIVFLVFYFFRDYISMIYNNMEEIRFYYDEYYYYWVFTILLIPIQSMFSSVLNLANRASIATKIHMISVIINLIFDYVLIFGIGNLEGMGIGGAAIATFISMLVSIIIQIIVLRKENIFILTLKLKYIIVIGKKILHFVLPNMVQGLSVPVGLIFLNSLVTKYSIEEVAAFTIIFRLELIYLSLAIGAYVAMGILISRNMGQKKYKKIQYIYNYVNKLVFSWAIFVFVFSLVFGNFIGSLFFENEKSIEYFTISWPLFNISLLFWWFIMSSNNLFTNLGKPFIATKINISRISLGLIICPLIGSYLFGFYGLILGVSIGTLISSLYVYYLWKKNNIQEKVSIKRIF